ncbi:MAG TPA: PE-PPE domain-containing protein, partial [Mycobacterium sp.]|nr:PE-PPE domain-containing protein [Mycobacterium sp.]
AMAKRLDGADDPARGIARSVVVVILVLLGVVLAGAGSIVARAGTAALIMGGTGQPDPAAIPSYMQNVEIYYIDPNTSCKVATCQLVSTFTPEQFWPIPHWGGLKGLKFDKSVAEGAVDLNAALLSQLVADPGGSLVVFGYSQSADIVTIEKRDLASASSTVKSQLSFVVIGDPNRPNGGILERFAPLSIPILGFTFDGAMPTDTGISTTDIAFQYDIAADFPEYPIDILADLNSLVGLGIHGSYPNTIDGYTPAELQQAMADPNNRQVYGDTTYITIPALNLPLLQPLRNFGVATGTSALITPLADLIQPTLQVLVELGYNRSIPYGQPTRFGLFPPIKPVELASELVAAAGAGVSAARADIAAKRALQTPDTTTPGTTIPALIATTSPVPLTTTQAGISRPPAHPVTTAAKDGGSAKRRGAH